MYTVQHRAIVFDANTLLYTNLLIYANFGWEFFLHVRKTVHRSAAAPIVYKIKIHTYFFNFSFLFRFGEFSHSVSQWIRNLRTLLRWQFIIYSLRACKSSQSSWTVAEAISDVDFYLSYWKNEISSERRGKYFTLKLKLVCCHVRARFLYHFQYKTRGERKEKGERWVGGKKSLYIHELFAIEMAGGFGGGSREYASWKKKFRLKKKLSDNVAHTQRIQDIFYIDPATPICHPPVQCITEAADKNRMEFATFFIAFMELFRHEVSLNKSWTKSIWISRCNAVVTQRWHCFDILLLLSTFLRIRWNVFFLNGI